MSEMRRFRCYACNHEWEVPYGTGQSGRQMKCPKCGSNNIHKADLGGPGRGRGPGPSGRGRGGAGRGPRFNE
jgi:DNA-directed RNA polymerase subunit RPC12/RpoP